VSVVYVELSGESPELALAEVTAAAEALGGRKAPPAADLGSLVAVEMENSSPATLAGRLALARRCLVVANLPPGESVRGEAGPVTAAFRPLHRPSGGGTDPRVLGTAQSWKAAGGRIDLERPDRRFWLYTPSTGPALWLEEVGSVDRPAVSARRISSLPFHRPVGLPPRLARAAANLARVGPGSRVIDPFLGTGALLAEAALLGARVTGIDRDPRMVQGALRNFAHLGVEARDLVVGDSGEVEFHESEGPYDAVLSDLPYGRASGTGGEEVDHLSRRVIPRWAERVRPGGRVVLVVAGGPDPLPPTWRRAVSVSLRVHRSLTREFRVYERAGG
jgi:tRNA (guanine10-N2)-dimethyltransferase